MKRSVLVPAVLIMASAAFAAQCSKAESAPQHQSEVMKHGEMAMGFSQTSSTHHFLLTASGGVVEVQANEAKDTMSREHIRHHLREISKSFGEGDFSSPMLTHGKVPPGVPEMQRQKRNISYTYVETDRGGKVVIRTSDTGALKAVHEFLRFQIEDHKTGDPETVRK